MNISIKHTLMAALFVTSVIFCNAEPQATEFNITNYPTVATIRQQFIDFEFPNKADGYNRNIKFWNTVDAETKTNYLEEVIQIAEDWNGRFEGQWPEIFSPAFLNGEVINNADIQLAAANVKICPQWQWHTHWNPAYVFHRCFENHRAALTELQRSENAARDELYHKYASIDDWPMAAWINHYVWCAGSGIVRVNSWTFQLNVLNKLPTAIKRRLREQGKSFFTNTETGQNPVQDAVDEFISACNSPRWEDVQEFVAKWWPDYEWVEIPRSNWLSDGDLEDLMDKVYYGEVDLDSSNVKAKLMNNLGLEAYNQFIERYNSGEME